MSRRKSRNHDSDRNRGNAPAARSSKRSLWGAVALGLVAIVVTWWLWNRPTQNDSPQIDVASTVEIPEPDLAQMQPLVAQSFRRAREGVVADPLSADAWGSFGAVCDAHFEYACAEPCYRQAMVLAPDKGQWVYLLALVRRGQGTDLAEAESLLRRAAESLPQFSVAPYRLAQLLSDQGKFAEAKTFYEKAIELDPRMAMAHDRLGKLLLVMGDTPAAVRHLETAYQLVSDDRALLAALGQAYMRQGDRKKADDMIARSRASVDTLALNDPLAEAVAAQAMSTTFLYQRAGALMIRGKFAKAIPELKAFAETYPDNVAVNVNLAIAYLKTRNPALAEEHFETLLRIRGELKRADAAVSPLDERLNQIDEAIVVYSAEYLELMIASGNRMELRKALDRFQDQAEDLSITAGAQMAWANALAELGINDAAIQHYREAIRLDPMFANAYYNLGYLFEDTGRMIEALMEYQRAAAIDPRGPGAMKLRELSISQPTPTTKDEGTP